MASFKIFGGAQRCLKESPVGEKEVTWGKEFSGNFFGVVGERLIGNPLNESESLGGDFGSPVGLRRAGELFGRTREAPQKINPEIEEQNQRGHQPTLRRGLVCIVPRARSGAASPGPMAWWERSCPRFRSLSCRGDQTVG